MIATADTIRTHLGQTMVGLVESAVRPLMVLIEIALALRQYRAVQSTYADR